MKHLAIALLIVSCATSKGERKNEKRNPSDDIQATYSAAVDRLKKDFIEDGWIVSRRDDGSTEHEGDSLIWTGIAMAALSCNDGQIFADRMRQMIEENNGALVRYEPLGEYAGGREISFDGATGLYYGLFQRFKRCEQDLQDWKPTWQKHLSFLKENNYRLHPNSNATVAPQFNSIRDYISYQLGIFAEPPSSWRYRTLEGMAMTWSSAVVESKQPCFRVHLAWLYMSFLDDADVMLESAYDGFCYATENAQMPVIDHWCGRFDITKWVEGFEFNRWEYENQRCASYEKPDGKGLQTPGLDLIFNIAFAYPEVLAD